VGTLAGPLRVFAVLVLLLAGVLVGRSHSTRRFRWGVLLLSVAAVACGAGLVWTAPGSRVETLFALGALLAGVDLCFRAFGHTRREFQAAATASVFAALLFLALDASALLGQTWRGLSFLVSRLAGAVIDKPLLLGPTYSGLNVTALVVLFLLVVFALRRERRPMPLACALVYLAAVGFLYLALMAFLPNFESDAQANAFLSRLCEDAPRWLAWLLEGLIVPLTRLFARHVPWNLPALLLLLELPALCMVAWRVDSRPVRVWPSTGAGLRWAGAFALAMLIAAAALVVGVPERPVMTRDDGAPTRVVLRKQGYLNWIVPDFNDYGEYAGGMFGRLPVFLRELGFDAVLADTLGAEALEGAQVAVVINPYEAMDNTEHEAIWDFVSRGGSLLVLGEHTWRTPGGKTPLDDLLRPSAIRVRFDSATWQIGGWIYNYGPCVDPVYYAIGRDLNQPGVGIGASLDLHAGARPLLLGTHGFSDRGHVKSPSELAPGEVQESFLGDNRYVPGEQLGDLVLAAEQDFGAGRVVVFGDTTGFINLLMVGSHRPAARVFARLASPAKPSRPVLRLVAALLFLAAAGALFAITPWRFVLPVLVVSVTAGFGVTLMRGWEARALDLLPRGDVACIDGSHVGKYSRDSWRDDGLAGLQLNLMRNGLQPLRMDTFSEERLAGARMLFIVAPTRTFTTHEVDAVERFVRRGGYVVVSAGAHSAEVEDVDKSDGRPRLAGVAPLLDRFGLRVRNTPLGPFTTYYADTRETVRMHDAYRVESTAGGTSRVLAWSWFGKPRTDAVIIE
ncbi:MAG TPA: DUF4350 domain-containing protein, partial [Planctomycetota bacterium]|nr:DUF4350 domain-containing protein [Planctomycetota bacterium]